MIVRATGLSQPYFASQRAELTLKMAFINTYQAVRYRPSSTTTLASQIAPFGGIAKLKLNEHFFSKGPIALYTSAIWNKMLPKCRLLYL